MADRPDNQPAGTLLIVGAFPAREALEDLLRPARLAIRTAADASTASVIVRACTPDGVLTPTLLPDSNGPLLAARMLLTGYRGWIFILGEGDGSVPKLCFIPSNADAATIARTITWHMTTPGLGAALGTAA
jgi:hypothetical protein